MLKKLIKKCIPQSWLWRHYYPYRWLWHNCRTLAREYNQLQSMREWKCIDNNKQPLPWYVYPCIEYLNNLDFSKKEILEFGGGQSSLYWAKRASHITTIESDKQWFKTLQSQQAPNQDLYLKTTLNGDPHQDYAHFALSLGKKFDCVIVDGGDINGENTRMACAKVAVEILNTHAQEGAMIILDNADWHRGCARFLREQGLIEIDFHGFGPINCYTWTTSIFLSRNFAFKPHNASQPHYSIDALHHDLD
ncbi:hypothetical protein [uncultured Helicobacter sp.]|uniref:hypothetical protein n=1 Tax=uncultured Helicobacter sp. TaxID=175537 RepID=UPI00374F3C54